MTSVFVSYARKEVDWVTNRLVPVLEAAGLDTLIDERFPVEGTILGQIDRAQIQADFHLIVLTRAYSASPHCQYELEQAKRLNPGCPCKAIIPVWREKGPLAIELDPSLPLFVKLDEESELDPHSWSKMLSAFSLPSTWSAPHWLDARDRVLEKLIDRKSVNLVVNGDTPWEALIRDISRHRGRLALQGKLAHVDFNSPRTHQLKNLVNMILEELETETRTEDSADALADLQQALEDLDRPPVIALTHFERAKRFDGDFFASLRFLIEEQMIYALFQSRIPFTKIVPADDPLSKIDLQRVNLR